jgi:lysozyme
MRSFAFVFNIGVGAWNGSTARRDLEAGKMTAIPTEMRRWVHDDHGNVIEGLVNRREHEISLFNTPIKV